MFLGKNLLGNLFTALLSTNAIISNRPGNMNFESIISMADLQEQVRLLQETVDQAIQMKSSSNLKALLANLLGGTLSLQVLKPSLMHLAKGIKSLSSDTFEEIANEALTLIKQHSLSFDETDYFLRESLFEYYVGCELYKQAAYVLSGANIDSPTNLLTDATKANIYVKCAEALLEDDETVEAEVFVNKASAYMHSADGDWALQLRYRTTYARILDANRKFVEAAGRYYELSTTSSDVVNQEDLMELLGKSVTCAILGKTGPQRSRIIQLLYKYERLTKLEQMPGYFAHAAILKKMHLTQLLYRSELSMFEDSLTPHQKVRTSDGLTIPEKAVLEHNFVAVGRLYHNISFEQLGILLQMSPQQVEKFAGRMIIEDRLKAVIDQTEGYLIFDSDDGENEATTQWDDQIKALCNEVSDCVDLIEEKYPGLLLMSTATSTSSPPL